MDFIVKDDVLTFLRKDKIEDYLIFYFNETWDNYNIKILVGSSKSNMQEIETNKNYVKIPNSFIDKHSLVVKIVGYNDEDTIETNYEIGRRC